MIFGVAVVTVFILHKSVYAKDTGS